MFFTKATIKNKTMNQLVSFKGKFKDTIFNNCAHSAQNLYVEVRKTIKSCTSRLLLYHCKLIFFLYIPLHFFYFCMCFWGLLLLLLCVNNVYGFVSKGSPFSTSLNTLFIEQKYALFQS